MIKTSLSLIALTLICTGCSPFWYNSNEARGVGTGAVVGAAGGAVVGHQSGHTAEGAVIGGASGAVVGGVIGGSVDQEKRNKKDRDQMLEHQQREISRQKREAEDLRRQQFQDEQFREKYGSTEE